MRHSLLLLLALGLLAAPLGCPSGDDDDTVANDDDTVANDDDDSVANDDDDSGGDDDDSASGWPGPGPEGSVVGRVRIILDEEGHGDDDDAGHGDDDDAGHGDDDDAGPGDDDDSASEEGEPVEGLTVTEVGTTNTAVTDVGGTFTLIMENYDPAQITMQVAGDLERIVVINEDGYRAVSSVVEVAASTEDHELDLHEELYGGVRDASLGTVDVQFEVNQDGDVTGATASVGGAALGPRVFQTPDITVPGNALLAGNERVVLFGNVSTGSQPLTVTVPSGFDCFAPASVTVVANAVTHVVVGCAAN